MPLLYGSDPESPKEEQRRAAHAARGPLILPLAEAKRQFVRQYLVELLTATDWNIRRAAKLSGVERSNLKRLMAEHDVPREEPLSAESARLLANGIRDTLEGRITPFRERAPRMEHVRRGTERRDGKATLAQDKVRADRLRARSSPRVTQNTEDPES